MEIVLTLIIVAAAFAALIWFLLKRKNQTRDEIPNLIKKFYDAREAQLQFSGELFGIRWRGKTELTEWQKSILTKAWASIDNLATRKGFNNPVLYDNWRQATRSTHTVYLFPPDTLSRVNKTPSLITAFRCDALKRDAYCTAPSDEQYRLLTVDSNFLYDENGTVVHPDIQAITVGGEGKHDTFGTDNQILYCIVPDEENEFNFNLAVESIVNEAQHGLAKNFDPATHEWSLQTNHYHPFPGYEQEETIRGFANLGKENAKSFCVHR